MAPVTIYTKPLTTAQAERLRMLLLERGFAFEVKPYMLYAASGQKVSVAVYEKGPKIVVQGKGTQDFVQFILEPEVLGTVELGYDDVLHPERYTPHIGVDESGKGDFFGPLVIAGAYVDASMTGRLVELGVMDSKRIGSDARMEALAGQMRGLGLVHEVIVIGPERYNELHTKFGNLNSLLAWGHARVIENLLDRVPDCPRALSDQFANPKVLQKALLERGKSIIMEQRTKAESDPAVAAASILAREKFIQWLARNGARWGAPLPRGASALVKETATRIVATEGRDALGKLAKLHFRTTNDIAVEEK